MTDASSLMAIYDLKRSPTPQELSVVETQLTRLATFMQTRVTESGALFSVETAAYAPALERLADESKR